MAFLAAINSLILFACYVISPSHDVLMLAASGVMGVTACIVAEKQ